METTSRRSFIRRAAGALSAGAVLSVADWVSPPTASASSILLGCYDSGPWFQSVCIFGWCLCYFVTYHICLWIENGCLTQTVEAQVHFTWIC